MNELVEILLGILRQHSIEAGLSSINKLCKGKPVVTLHSNGHSPGGKAQDFDSCIPLVQIQYAQFGDS